MLAGECGRSDVCLSITSVGVNGLEAALLPNLNDAELEGFRYSAEVLEERIRGIEI